MNLASPDSFRHPPVFNCLLPSAYGLLSYDCKSLSIVWTSETKSEVLLV
jgi:hypothetical protein